MTLHFNGVGSNAKVFESLSSMLSRNALNPADVSTVRERERERERMNSYSSVSSYIVVMLKKLNSPLE